MVIVVTSSVVIAAMRVCVVAPAGYAHVGKVLRKEVAEPVDAVARRPRVLPVSVHAMDGDDAWAG
jgi:hypothetical protein